MVALVKQELLRMEQREKEILTKLYFKGYSTTSLAKEMGVTKSWVSRLHSKAILRLRNSLVKLGALPDSS